jgi:hypothetical protein
MARKLTGWNIFVAKVRKENPGKSFKEILKLASTLKKQGKMNSTMSLSKGKKRKTRRR